MRSEIASKILSETAPETREKVRKYADEVMSRKAEIEAIELTDEEIRRAIWSAKITKWNEELNRDYWQDLENQKPTSNESKEMVSYKTDAPTVQTVKNLVQKRVKKRWGNAHKANKTVQ